MYLTLPLHRAYAHWDLILFSILATASVYSSVTLIDVALSVRDVVHERTQQLPGTAQMPTKALEEYTFVGSDRPKYLPLPHRPALVRMQVEESVHYALTAPESSSEWLWTAPIGDNHIRLGPPKRAFAIAMVHELHCLRGIRTAIDLGLAALPQPLAAHVHHCFEYLRKWTLCAADVTLERGGDFAARNWTADSERAGTVHVCRDWEPVYEMVAGNWREWEEFRVAHGLPKFEN